jgi:hypothetical protein
MPELSAITYSREATIAAIRSFYHFLVSMYMPETAIIEPPTTGWPEITAAAFRAFGKTDEVIELLRHIPYIREPSDDTLKIQCAPDCYFADYRSGIYDAYLEEGHSEAIKIVTEGQDCDNVPAHVVGLTSGGRDDPRFLLDTHLGIIYWVGCPEGPKHHPSREPIVDNPEDYAPENERDWRADAPAWSVEDFFEVLIDEFRRLNFLPLNRQEVLDSSAVYVDAESDLIPLLQRVYRDHAWPNLVVYKKEKCLDTVREVLLQYYPHLVS